MVSWLRQLQWLSDKQRYQARPRRVSSVPNPKFVTKFPGGASRLAALLRAHIDPLCSLVAPGDPGAAPGTLATIFGIGTLGCAAGFQETRDVRKPVLRRPHYGRLAVRVLRRRIGAELQQ